MDKELIESETLTVIDLEKDSIASTSILTKKTFSLETEAEIIKPSELPPDRPVSAISLGIDAEALEAGPEAEMMSSLNSPSTTAPREDDNDDEEDSSAGYEESAERDEIIRERINRTQDQMR